MLSLCCDLGSLLLISVFICVCGRETEADFTVSCLSNRRAVNVQILESCRVIAFQHCHLKSLWSFSMHCSCRPVRLSSCLRWLKRERAGRSDTGPCMLRWSRIASWQMVCRLITRSTRPIARDETVLTVSNALPRGPYHPLLLACLPPSPVSLLLMLSIWRFMQKCAASRPPRSPSILSAGTPACHRLSCAEVVKLRLLASCVAEAFLSVHFKQGWCL